MITQLVLATALLLGSVGGLDARPGSVARSHAVSGTTDGAMAGSLCRAAPGLIARQQALALQPRFRPELARLRAAPFYRLSLAPNLAAHTVDVREAVCYTNTTGDTLGALALRLYANFPPPARYRIVAATVGGRTAVARLDPRDPTFALLALPAPLRPGGRAEVQLSLLGHLPVAATDAPGDIAAMQFVDGGALGQFPHYLDLAWSYAQVGVYAGHRWGHARLTGRTDTASAAIAFFDAMVVVPRGFGVVSSGVTIGSVAAGATRRLHIVTGPVRDFTLQASPGLALIAQQAGGVRIESAYLPTASGTAAATARLVALRAGMAMALADRSFGPYPYAKLTLAEAPIVAYGLQWSTLIQLAADFYRVPQTDPDLGVPLYIPLGFLIAHEVSHQWWYGLVGNDVVDAGYLSEGLATYSETFLPLEQVRALKPALVARIGDQMRRTARAAVLSAYWFAGGRDVAIDRPAAAAPGGDPFYTNYHKASEFFYIYADRFGRASLLDFLRRYAAENRWGIATLGTLQRALEEAAPGHERTVRLLVTDWFRLPDAARVIDMHAIPLRPMTARLAATLAALGRAAPGLRAIGLQPEVLLQLGYDPMSQVVRTYTTRGGE